MISTGAQVGIIIGHGIGPHIIAMVLWSVFLLKLSLYYNVSLAHPYFSAFLLQNACYGCRSIHAFSIIVERNSQQQ